MDGHLTFMGFSSLLFVICLCFQADLLSCVGLCPMHTSGQHPYFSHGFANALKIRDNMEKLHQFELLLDGVPAHLVSFVYPIGFLRFLI